MDQFATARVYQANPSPLKKRLFLVLGVAGAISLTLALLGKGPVDQRPFYFGGGITAVAFAIRFWTMQVGNSATVLTFDRDGVSIGNPSSPEKIPWADLAGISYQVSRSGHRWRFTTRDDRSVEFYLDGLTGSQRKELEDTITSIKNSTIKVVPFYDPLGLADAA